MAKWEIMSRVGPLEGLWWRLMPGVEIEVPWPTGRIVVGPNSRNWSGMGPMCEEIFSADPNDHFRPELEQFVGKQGRDWNWRIGKVSNVSDVRDTLVIKIRKAKSEYATIAAMRWV